MKNRLLKLALFVLATVFIQSVVFAQPYTLSSPNGAIVVTIVLDDQGTLKYEASRIGVVFIKPSALGVVLSDGNSFASGIRIIGNKTHETNQTWNPVWGEERVITDRHNSLLLQLQQQRENGLLLNVEFRVFNDGIAFRYEWPAQAGLRHFIVKREMTEFAMADNHKAWWMPGDYDTNEYTYATTNLSEVEADRYKNFSEIGVKEPFSNSGVQTPLMMKTSEGLYLNIHEAALVNYPAMQLNLNKANFTLQAHLVPDAVGNMAYLQAPARSPWRTVLVSNKATDLLASRTILNLNEPSVIKDPSFIKPSKFVGVWWEMHAGNSSWDYAGSPAGSLDQPVLTPSGKHGATTANVKRYIDFAAKHGFSGVLVEGWNVGWEDWSGNWKENVFDFVTPYPDFDVKELNKYAAAKGVKMMMHHETSGSVTNYERHMDTAYRLMKRFGYDAVKTGYVGRIIPRGEHHDGQWMVNHYNRVARTTANYGIMVDMHESVRPTGMHRTYPNWLACEAARGNEFNAWSEGNPPEHETILPFTRLLGGPMDYTPGIFEIKMNYWDKTKTTQVHTTLAKQLALYITIYSPLQMAADLPDAYERRLDAFQFIKDVAVDWDASYYLEAEPGDYVTIARKTKGKLEWFVGAITDEQARVANIDLSFLPAGKTYKATIYRDDAKADWKNNPMAYVIETKVVKAGEMLKLQLAAGGGCAVRIVPQ